MPTDTPKQKPLTDDEIRELRNLQRAIRRNYSTPTTFVNETREARQLAESIDERVDDLERGR